MRTALGVSPLAMRLLPISWAENCFLILSARRILPSWNSPRERRGKLDSVDRVREVLARDKLSDLAQGRIRVKGLDEGLAADMQADLETRLRRLGRLAAAQRRRRLRDRGGLVDALALSGCVAESFLPGRLLGTLTLVGLDLRLDRRTRALVL